MDMDDPISVSPRHVLIYLGDYDLCGFHRGLTDIYRNSQRTKAVSVGRRDLYECDV